MLAAYVGGAADAIRFPPFEIDLTGGCLLHENRPVEIRPKSLAVLQYLAERPGQLVSKDQILAAVWAGVHVEEDVLKVSIADVRKVLGETRGQPKFIDTVYGRGYRFIAEVRSPADPSVPFRSSPPWIPETRYTRSGDVNIAYQIDAAGSRRAVLCGVSEGASMAAFFAAKRPERTSALAMIGSYAKRVRDAGYPWGPTEAERERFLDEIRDHWGGPVGLEERAPSVASDPEFRRWWATYLRMSASPGAAVALTRMNSQADIRDILREIRVPSLVVHRTGDRCLRVEEGRYVASLIPGCRFVELPGIDHLPFVGDQDAILNALEAFLANARVTSPSAPRADAILSGSFRMPRGEPSLRSSFQNRLRDQVQQEIDRLNAHQSKWDQWRVYAAFRDPVNAIRCGWALASRAARYQAEARAGVHIGVFRMRGRKVVGEEVEFARRVEAQARAGETLVSALTRDLASHAGIRFQTRGSVSVAERGPVNIPHAGPA
jgi:DNA-binding winged helix-turn-helix (wHTH) protein